MKQFGKSATDRNHVQPVFLGRAVCGEGLLLMAACRCMMPADHANPAGVFNVCNVCN